MTFSYTPTQVQDLTNGTALLSVNPTKIGGGFNASGFATLGLGSPEGIKLNIMQHTNAVYTDLRGPGVPQQMINNGADGYITTELWMYDQQVLMQFLEQRTDGNDSSSYPTGFAVNVGELMFDSLPFPATGANTSNTSALTSCVKITAPRNRVGASPGTPYQWILPRCWIESDAQFNLSTQSLYVPIRIGLNPDASGYLYYRITSTGAVRGYTPSDTQNELQNNITLPGDQGNLSG